LERGHLARIGRCGRDARAPRFADRVQADSSLERGHLARFCSCGRDARAPCFAGGTRAPCFARARRPGNGPRAVALVHLQAALLSVPLSDPGNAVTNHCQMGTCGQTAFSSPKRISLGVIRGTVYLIVQRLGILSPKVDFLSQRAEYSYPPSA